MTFSGQGLQSSEGGFLFKPLGFCNLPELVPLSQQTWSRNLREELGGCESSSAEGPWEVRSTAEVWFAHPDPNHHSVSTFCDSISFPSVGCAKFSSGSRDAPSAVPPLMMAAPLAGGQAEGVDVHCLNPAMWIEV